MLLLTFTVAAQTNKVSELVTIENSIYGAAEEVDGGTMTSILDVREMINKDDPKLGAIHTVFLNDEVIKVNIGFIMIVSGEIKFVILDEDSNGEVYVTDYKSISDITSKQIKINGFIHKKIPKN